MSSSRDPDDVIFEKMDEMGDDPSKPRPTRFWFYGALDRLNELAALLRADGMTIYETNGDKPGIIVETELTMERDSFDATAERMIDLADAYGLDFDGWETEIVRNVH